MKPPGSEESAFTLLEAVIALCLIGVLIALSIPMLERPHRSSLIQCLSNMRELCVVTFQMAQDGATTGDTNIGWPDDTEGSFARWTQALAAGNYLKTNELIEILSLSGRNLPPGGVPTNNDGAILVYAMKKNADSSTIILTSGNFTNTPTGGAPLNKSVGPFGDKGFVVMRAGGDGVFCKASQAGSTNIGSYAPLCR